jgi:hypothetical protein
VPLASAPPPPPQPLAPTLINNGDGSCSWDDPNDPPTDDWNVFFSADNTVFNFDGDQTGTGFASADYEGDGWYEVSAIVAGVESARSAAVHLITL